MKEAPARVNRMSREQCGATGDYLSSVLGRVEGVKGFEKGYAGEWQINGARTAQKNSAVRE
jgi:hypothetical protein